MPGLLLTICPTVHLLVSRAQQLSQCSQILNREFHRLSFGVDLPIISGETRKTVVGLIESRVWRVRGGGSYMRLFVLPLVALALALPALAASAGPPLTTTVD